MGVCALPSVVVFTDIECSGVLETNGRFCMCLCPQPHSKPTVRPWSLICLHFLLPQFTLWRWIAHNCFASTTVNGARLFALVEYHTTYAVKHAHRAGAIIHRLDMNILNMFFTLCIFVVHGYNMS